MPTQSSLPAVHTLDLLELVARWGVKEAELLAGLPLTRAALAAPAARLPLPMVSTVLDRARTLTGEPALGIYLGLKMRISAHGFLGFAAMVAPTIRDALAIATRFAPTRTDALSLRLEEHDGLAHLAIVEHADFGAAREAVIFALLTGIWRIGAELVGSPLTGSADIAFPEPVWLPRVAHLIPGQIRFSQPEHRLVFDRALLDAPLPLADSVAEELARAQCEKELEALGFSERILPRVTARLPGEDGRPRSLAQVARALAVSARTLKRRLADEQTTFSAVRDAWLRDRATALLLNADLAIEVIADRLGYSDAANFSRAFARWTGTAPGAWRRAQKIRRDLG